MENNLTKFFEQSNKEFLESIDIPYPYNRPITEWDSDANENKKIVYADLHEQYTDEVLMNDSLQHKDAGTAIVAGDISDFYSKSRFRKTKNVDYRIEVLETFKRLEWLATHYKRVKILLGNHDNRPEKKIQELFSIAGEMDLKAINTERSLLARLAAYFDNIELVNTKVRNHNYEIELTHIHQEGDAIITHGELSLKQSSAIMERVSNYLHMWNNVLKLSPYRVIMQAHNHRAYKSIEGNELWMLVPCGMETVSIGSEYIFAPKMYGKPPVKGYAILYQENGMTDFNRTNFYVYK
jgi:predicted phosphodiesterase